MNDIYKDLNLDLAERALNGDEEAARLFCGSYDIYVNPTDNKYYRVKGDAPREWKKIQGVHDKDGFLKPYYWSYPRFLG